MFLPMLILASFACSGVLIVAFWYGIVSWMKIVNPPCARMFVCPSLNNPLHFFKLKFVCFDSIVSWMQGTSGFSLAIMSSNSYFLFAIIWMFHCTIFAFEMLKPWICGGRLLGLWFYICWSFIFLVFSLLCHLRLPVGRAGSFYFSLFPQYSIHGRRTVQAVSRLR